MSRSNLVPPSSFLVPREKGINIRYVYKYPFSGGKWGEKWVFRSKAPLYVSKAPLYDRKGPLYNRKAPLYNSKGLLYQKISSRARIYT